MAHEGNLAVLLKLIDDPAAIRKDEIEFAKARRLFQLATREVDKLKREIADRDEIMETSGRQVAAVVSTVLATIALVGIVVSRAGAEMSGERRMQKTEGIFQRHRDRAADPVSGRADLPAQHHPAGGRHDPDGGGLCGGPRSGQDGADDRRRAELGRGGRVPDHLWKAGHTMRRSPRC